MHEWSTWTLRNKYKNSINGKCTWYSMQRGFPKSNLHVLDLLCYNKKNLYCYLILLHSFFPRIANFCLYKLSDVLCRYLIFARNCVERWPSSERAQCISGAPDSVTRNRRKIAALLSGGETISPWKRYSTIEDPRNAWPRRIESALPNGTQIQWGTGTRCLGLHHKLR